MSDEIEIRIGENWLPAYRVTIDGVPSVAWMFCDAPTIVRESRATIRPRSTPIRLPSGEAAAVGEITCGYGAYFYRVDGPADANGSIPYSFWRKDDREWRRTGSGWFCRLATAAEIATTTIALADVPERVRGEVEKLRTPTVEPWSFETMPVAVKVREKKTRSVMLAAPYSNFCVWLPNVICNVMYSDLLRDYEQLDGSPCGVVRGGKGAA